MEIKIYTTPHGIWRKKLKEWLKAKKKPFQEIDVMESDTGWDELLEKTAQMATPVIEIDGKVLVGFHEHKLEEVFKK